MIFALKDTQMSELRDEIGSTDFIQKLYHFQLIDLHHDLRDTRIIIYILL